MTKLSGALRVSRLAILILASTLVVAAAALAMQVKPAEAATMPVADWSRAFLDLFDKNDDGKLNLNFNKETNFENRCYCQLLHAVDTNEDFYVVSREMKRFWTKRDLNGDGSISSRELDKTLQLYPPF